MWLHCIYDYRVTTNEISQQAQMPFLCIIRSIDCVWWCSFFLNANTTANDEHQHMRTSKQGIIITFMVFNNILSHSGTALTRGLSIYWQPLSVPSLI